MVSAGSGMVFVAGLVAAHTIVFRHVPDPIRDFVPIRLVGIVGWVLAGAATNALSSLDGAAGTGSSIPFLIGAGVSATLAVYSLFLPHTPPLSPSGPEREEFGTLLKAACDPSVVVFATVAGMVGVGLGLQQAPTGEFLTRTIGNPRTGVLAGHYTELLLLPFLPVLIRTAGVKAVVWLVLTGWTIRYLMFASGGPTGDGLPMVWFGIALYAICDGAYVTACAIHINRSFPTYLPATGQGVLCGLTYGAGLGFGCLVGILFGESLRDPFTLRMNWAAFWLFAALGVIAVTIMFLWLYEPRTMVEPATSSRLILPSTAGGSGSPPPIAEDDGSVPDSGLVRPNTLVPPPDPPVSSDSSPLPRSGRLTPPRSGGGSGHLSGRQSNPVPGPERQPEGNEAGETSDPSPSEQVAFFWPGAPKKPGSGPPSSGPRSDRPAPPSTGRAAADGLAAETSPLSKPRAGRASGSLRPPAGVETGEKPDSKAVRQVDSVGATGPAPAEAALVPGPRTGRTVPAAPPSTGGHRTGVVAGEVGDGPRTGKASPPSSARLGRPGPLTTPAGVTTTRTKTPAPEAGASPESKRTHRKTLPSGRAFAQQCRRSQTALKCMMWGGWVQAAAIVLVVATWFSTLALGTDEAVVMGLITVAVGAMAGLLFLAGMMSAGWGHKSARAVARIGIVVVLAHWGVCFWQSQGGFATSQSSGAAEDLLLWPSRADRLNAVGFGTSLLHLTDLLPRIVLHFPVSVLGIISGLLEFSRVVFVYVVVRRYAVAGGLQDTGESWADTVWHLFLGVLVLGFARLLLTIPFDGLAGSWVWLLLGWICHGALSLITLGWMVRLLLYQAREAQGAIETISPDNVAEALRRMAGVPPRLGRTK